MRRMVFGSLAALALLPANASAATYILTTVGSQHDQTNIIGTSFIPHFGYAGGPVQSWGFGINNAAGGGWLDFFTDGVSLIHEASITGNDFFQTTSAFYTLTNNQLNILAPVNGGPQTYALVGGGNLVITAVPEPATWALMIAGFGAVGYGLRRRKQPALAAANA